MRHPLQRIGRPAPVFWALLAVTVVLTLAFQLIGPASPGIVAFEFAGNAARAGEILGLWDRQAQLAAAFGLGFDYLYMPVYSTTIALACVWAARGLPGGAVRWLVQVAAWGAWVAALFDAAENVALLRLLLSGPDGATAAAAAVCAGVKFVLIAFGVVAAVVAAVVRRRMGAAAFGSRA